MKKTLLIVGTFIALAGCDAPPRGPLDANGTAREEIGSKQFQCPETAMEYAASAESISYDNSGSRLSDKTVQGAIDELAARPERGPAPLLRLVQLSEHVKADKDQTWTSTLASCDKGGQALGGSCSTDRNGDGVTVSQTELSANGFSCIWHKEAGVTGKFTATVSCLMPTE